VALVESPRRTRARPYSASAMLPARTA
jgi:hypothetical protein